MLDSIYPTELHVPSRVCYIIIPSSPPFRKMTRGADVVVKGSVISLVPPSPLQILLSPLYFLQTKKSLFWLKRGAASQNLIFTSCCSFHPQRRG